MSRQVITLTDEHGEYKQYLPEMTEELDIKSIFSMETVAEICCPQPSKLRQHWNEDMGRGPKESEPCPTCDGQGTVDYPGTTDGTQMDCTNPNCRDFEREE